MIGWVIFLFIAGMVLILAEFIVPGGVVGAVGGFCVLGSMGLGVYSYPDSAVFIIVLEVLGTVVAVGLGMFLLSRTRMGKLVILGSSQKAEAGWVSDKSEESLVGKEGEVFTQLRPAGTVMIDGKRINAVSSGDLIPKGAKVRVIEVHGNRVVVEQTFFNQEGNEP